MRPGEILLLHYLRGFETDCLDSQRPQFALEQLGTFDLGYLDRHVLVFDEALHDGRCGLQRRMTGR